MNTNAAPGNTRHAATPFQELENVSRHQFHFEEIEQIVGRAR